jgi:stage II sporulation protein D
MKIHLRHYKYFIVFFLALFLFAGQPVEFGQEIRYFQGFSIKKPVIRVGLHVNLNRVVIRSSSGMKVFRQDANLSLLAQDILEAQVKGFREKLSEKFLIQVGPSVKNEEAQDLARRLKSSSGYSVSVTADQESRLSDRFQVRLGPFMTRGDALKFFPQLNKLGHQDLWIVREEVTERESRPLWVLINDQLIQLSDGTSLMFVPMHAESYLSYEGTDYRGVLQVAHSPRGVVLVNMVNLDDYLKGVVPSELSPHQFGELEALKAQAVAARTYALKNKGRYEELGFDLDDSQSSQVYNGLSAEHALSNRAVEETVGLVARHRGQLINALYTSTCGGMTENAENIFEGSPVPYLQSEECTTERRPSWTLESGAGRLRPVVWKGRDISREAAVLTALDLFPAWGETATPFRAPLGRRDAAAAVEKALALFGRKREAAAAGEAPLTAAAFAGMVVDAFQWRDRVKNLMLKKEADRLMGSAGRLRAEDREAAAFLALSGYIPPGIDPSDETHVLTRAEAVLILFKIVTAEKPLLQSGVFRRLDKGRMSLRSGGEEMQLETAPGALLMRSVGGEPFFASSLELEPGDGVRFVERDGILRWLEASRPDDNPVLDKPSPYNRWQVRLTHAEAERRVNQYYPLGGLVDVIPWKRGASPRVTELLLAGKDAQVVVRGLKVRWVIGLRDTWFTVDREYNEQGLISHFVFTGRGWGHGVGLCQVGAYRLAQLGGRFETILKKYYRGITIDKIY